MSGMAQEERDASEGRITIGLADVVRMISVRQVFVIFRNFKSRRSAAEVVCSRLVAPLLRFDAVPVKFTG